MAKTKELLQDIRKLLTKEEFSDEDLKTLWDLKESFEENIEWMVDMIYSFQWLETEAKVVEENAKARKTFYKNQQERLKSAISFFMHQAGKDKLETGKVRINFRDSEVVVIDTNVSIPMNYSKTKTIIEPDKLLIKEALKNGEKFSRARLEEKKNIQIK